MDGDLGTAIDLALKRAHDEHRIRVWISNRLMRWSRRIYPAAAIDRTVREELT